MIKFRNERVLSFELDYLDVLWEIEPTNEDIQEYQFLSSSLLKEVASLNGSTSCLVPEFVAEAFKVKSKLRQKAEK